MHVTTLVPFGGFHGSSLVVLWHHDVNMAPLQHTQCLTLREKYVLGASDLWELEPVHGKWPA